MLFSFAKVSAYEPVVQWKVKFVHSLNASLLILVTLSGIVILVKLLQSRNADALILVTLLGSVILVKLLQPKNA